MFVRPPICLSIHPSVHLSIHLSIRPSVHPPRGLSQAQGGPSQVLGGPRQALEGQIQVLGGSSQGLALWSTCNVRMKVDDQRRHQCFLVQYSVVR